MSKYNPDYWAPLLAAAAPDLPTDKLVAWIREESDGQPGALGTVYEVGIFQIDLEDGPAWGASIATLHGNFTVSASSQVLTRELTDAEEQLQVSSGIAYVRHCLSVAQSYLSNAGASWDDEDLWCLVKLVHALPALVVAYVPAAAQADTVQSWGDYRSFCESLSSTDAAAISSAAARYMPWGHLFDNAEKVGYAGQPNAPVGAVDVGLLFLLAAAALFLSRYVF